MHAMTSFPLLQYTQLLRKTARHMQHLYILNAKFSFEENIKAIRKSQETTAAVFYVFIY